MYKENPKTKGSGIVCCIPQTGECPVGCSDCFFQSGRSFLEPLKENLPNMPERLEDWQILRINDGHDSNVNRKLVIEATDQWKGKRFFNTSFAAGFDDPYVLTVNPGKDTNKAFATIGDDTSLMDNINSLMFVRIRTNLWNLELVKEAIDHYTEKNVPIVLTFMAYYNDDIPKEHQESYEFRKRTLNSYYVIKFDAWKKIMSLYEDNPLVHSCSGPNNFACKNCGTCLREFHSTMERINTNES